MSKATFNPAERDVWCDDMYSDPQFIMRGYPNKRQAYYALLRFLRDDGFGTEEYPKEKSLERIEVRFCECGFWSQGEKCCDCKKKLTGPYEYMYRFSI